MFPWSFVIRRACAYCVRYPENIQSHLQSPELGWGEKLTPVKQLCNWSQVTMNWFSSGYLLSINKTETGTLGHGASRAGCLDNLDQIPATVTAANCWELSTSLQGREAEGRPNTANSVRSSRNNKQTLGRAATRDIEDTNWTTRFDTFLPKLKSNLATISIFIEFHFWWRLRLEDGGGSQNMQFTTSRLVQVPKYVGAKTVDRTAFCNIIISLKFRSLKWQPSLISPLLPFAKLSYFCFIDNFASKR